MKITRIKVMGFENAIVGMRFPKNSEDRIDSYYSADGEFIVGPGDLELIKKLSKAGRDHRKVLRMIHVQAAVDMPISWWIQYDTYKVATVANSRSRMHKLGSRLLTKDDFYVEHWDDDFDELLVKINGCLSTYMSEENRQSTLAKKAWRKTVDLIPMSYQQERMVDLNYETLLTIFRSRWSEKLSNEWKYFITAMAERCPYLLEIYERTKGEADDIIG